MPKQPFKEIEHTADTGLEVYGTSLEQLFHNAAKGMHSLAGLEDVQGNRPVLQEINLQENNAEDLLISFLNELNYYLIVHRGILKSFIEIEVKTEKNKTWSLHCTGKLVTLPKRLFSNIQEIESATYHQIEIIRKEGGFLTRIFFDL